MIYTNSPLIQYTKISPNKTAPRKHNIDTITIHCMAGNLSVETCGNLFASPSRKASSNYGIGSDGRIALYVEEKDRSWCSSNSANDHRAVTIEVANDGGADTGWHVSDQAMASLIELTADICRRNHINELRWKADPSLIGQVDQQNMTVHRWFAAKACPGDYLYRMHSYIADTVNRKLGTAQDTAPISPSAAPQATPAEPTAPSAISQAPSAAVLKISSGVSSIQIWLNTYYQAALTVDGAFGPKTRSALIRAWQTEVGGLSADGIFGAKSKAAAASHMIKKGSCGILVTLWQAYLVCCGYDPKGIDGIFGAGCRKATIAFQNAAGLTPDGIVGPDTWYGAFHG